MKYNKEHNHLLTKNTERVHAVKLFHHFVQLGQLIVVKGDHCQAGQMTQAATDIANLIVMEMKLTQPEVDTQEVDTMQLNNEGGYLKM